MRYRIAYDQPGRLRVRFGPDAFTQEQGYGIAALLPVSYTHLTLPTTERV